MSGPPISPPTSQPKRFERAHAYPQNPQWLLQNRDAVHANLIASMHARIHSTLPPLDESTQQIRLVTLHRAPNRADSISISLFPFSLALSSSDEAAPYECLSYTWGDTRITRLISVNGLPLGITYNLHEALIHLRRETDDRVLWVDALCINQGDVATRNAQVKLMSAIYSRALRVLIWLGPEGGDSKKALETLRVMGEDRHHSEMPIYTTPIAPDEGEGGNDDTKIPQFSAEPFYPLVALLHRPWWGRIWTVQEIVVAREARIMVGDDVIAWDELVRAAMMVRKHRFGCCALVSLRSQILMNTIMGRVLELTMRFETVRRKRAQLRDEGFEEVDVEGAEIGEKNNGERGLGASTEGKSGSKRKERMRKPWLHVWETKFLLESVEEFRANMCTDDRDKLLGLLGICKVHSRVEDVSKHPILEPDYGKTAEELYRQLAVNMIRQTGSLQIFKHANYTRRRPGIPSWCPDWNAPTYSGQSIVKKMHIQSSAYEAFVHRKAKVEDLGPAGGLKLKGVLWDQVEEVGGMVSKPDAQGLYSTADEDVHLYQPTLKSWERMVGISSEVEYQVDEKVKEGTYVTGSQPLSEALYRTLMLDMTADRGDGRQRRMISADLPHWRRFREWIMQVPDKDHSFFVRGLEQHELRWIFINVFSINAMMRLVRTKKGYIAMTPAETKVGDWVGVLAGGQNFWTLREVLTYETEGNSILFNEDSEGEAELPRPFTVTPPHGLQREPVMSSISGHEEADNTSLPDMQSADEMDERVKAFELVGFTYLHGLMDGEMVDKVNSGEAKFESLILV
ncbi:hypothetical protein MMC25_004080 [Agyrium rufum]|nr:hypothetical protein [Agyrium rufum]